MITTWCKSRWEAYRVYELKCVRLKCDKSVIITANTTFRDEDLDLRNTKVVTS